MLLSSLLTWMLLLLGTPHTWGSSIAHHTSLCEQVKPIFESKGISAGIPDKPINGSGLLICQAKSSCCTREMEADLGALVRRDFQALLHHNSRSLEGLLASTASSLQDQLRDLCRRSINKTQALFQLVYHRIAQDAKSPLLVFYSSMVAYLDLEPDPESPHITSLNSDVDLDTAVRRLFSELFPLVYQQAVTTSNQPRFAPNYANCLQQASASGDIQPFDYHPRTIASALNRNLEAARVLLQALRLGAQVLNTTDQILMAGISDQCRTALLRMSYCSKCHGLGRNIKPCTGYCLNVLRGCLSLHAAELDLPWNGYVDAVERLAITLRDQQLGLKKTLLSLDEKISEAVMYALENGPELERKVRRTCGQATWLQEELMPKETINPTSTISPESGVIESTSIGLLLASVSKSRGFYANLAESLCSDESFAETRDTAECWNGHNKGGYIKTVVSSSLSAQKYNPELTWTQPEADPRIPQLSDQLRHIRQVLLSQMNQAPETDALLHGDPEGSGSGHRDVSLGPWTDTDDSEPGHSWQEQGSGSGDHETENRNNWSIPKTTQSEVPKKSSSGSSKSLNISPLENLAFLVVLLALHI